MFIFAPYREKERQILKKLNKKTRVMVAHPQNINQMVMTNIPTFSYDPVWFSILGSSSSSEPMETSGPSTVLPKLPDPVLTSAELSIEKRPKLSASSKNKSSKSSSGSGKSKGSPTKKTPQDKLEKRDAYRSLFTSTAPARSKEHTSHWVTFFPYH